MKKKFLSKALSMILAIVMVVLMVPAGSITALAATQKATPSYIEFQAKHYAQNFSMSSELSYASNLYDQLKEDSSLQKQIKAWEALHIIESPSHALKSGEIFKKDFYKIAIFDMLDASNENSAMAFIAENAYNDRESAVYDLVNILLEEFNLGENDVSKLDFIDIKEFRKFANDFDWNEFIGDFKNDFSSPSFSTIDTIDLVFDVFTSVTDAVNAAASYRAIANMRNGVLQVLQAIAEDENNDWQLRLAARECLPIFNDSYITLLNEIATGYKLYVGPALTEVMGIVLDLAWEAFIYAIPGANALMFGVKGFRALMNAAFALDERNELYYKLESAVIIERAVRRIALKVRTSVLANTNKDKAGFYMESIYFYQKAIIQGISYSIQYLENYSDSFGSNLLEWITGKNDLKQSIETAKSIRADRINVYSLIALAARAKYKHDYCQNQDSVINKFNNQVKPVKFEYKNILQVKAKSSSKYISGSWYNLTNGSSNIQKAGCGIVALVSAVYNLGGTIDQSKVGSVVDEVFDWAYSKGYWTSSGSYWSLFPNSDNKFGEKYGFKVSKQYGQKDSETTSLTSLINHIKGGKGTAVVHVYGHFMAVVDYKVENGKEMLLVLDPAPGAGSLYNSLKRRNITHAAGDWIAVSDLKRDGGSKGSQGSYENIEIDGYWLISPTGTTAVTNSTNPDSYSIPTRDIVYKSSGTMTGDDVRWIQAVLYQLGYSIDIDGSFGPASRDTVKKFQSDFGLTVDGQVGPATRAKLRECWENKNIYTFSFNANGGTGPVNTFTVKYGYNFTIVNTECVRSGYTFDGWVVKRNTDDTWYVAGEGWCSESTISANSYSKKVYSNYQTLNLDYSWGNGISGVCSFTFYALWKKDTHTTHSFGSWEPFNHAQHKRECSCGAVEYAAHEWNDGIITSEPTATEEGLKIYTCVHCGDNEFETIPVTNDRIVSVINTDINVDGKCDRIYLESTLVQSVYKIDKGDSNPDLAFDCYAVANSKGIYIWVNIKGEKTFVNSVGEYLQKDYLQVYYNVSQNGEQQDHKGWVMMDYHNNLRFKINNASVEAVEGFESAAVITSEGWAAEMFIPWREGTPTYEGITKGDLNTYFGLGIQYNDDYDGKELINYYDGYFDCAIYDKDTTQYWSDYTLLPEVAFVEHQHTLVNGVCTVCEAASGACGQNLKWVLDFETGVLTISGTGNMYDYTRQIGAPWYSNRAFIKTVIIESGATSIGACAFYGCDNITSLTIPEGINRIGDHALHGCERLPEISLPSTLEIIEDEAFHDCRVLESIEIPASVIAIGTDVLGGCYALATITVQQGNTNYKAVNNCLIEIFTRTLISGSNSCVIPGDGSVEKIAYAAFCGKTGLELINIPNSIYLIGEYAFFDCVNLDTIVYCGTSSEWENVEKENKWNSRMFATVQFHSYESGVCTVCGTEELIVNILSGTCGANGGNLVWVLDLDTGVLTISGVGAMADYPYDGQPWENYRDFIKTVIVKDGVTSIGKSAFIVCNYITSVSLPDSLNKIDNHAFFACDGLSKINIPTSVSYIGAQAFASCNELTEIIYCGTLEQWTAISKDESWLDYISPFILIHKYANGICTECGDEENAEISDDAPQLVISDKAAVAGGMVQITVSIKNNPGVWAVAFELPIDENVFEFVSADTSSSVFGQFGVCGFDESVGAYKFNGYNSDLMNNITSDGTVVVITLKVKENVSFGEYELELDLLEDNIINVDQQTVELYSVSGTVSVQDFVLGDVNGDGDVTNSDVLMIFRYIYNAELYPVSLEIGDVNGDGDVTNSDVLVIYRYIYNPDLYPIG